MHFQKTSNNHVIYQNSSSSAYHAHGRPRIIPSRYPLSIVCNIIFLCNNAINAEFRYGLRPDFDFEMFTLGPKLYFCVNILIVGNLFTGG